MKIAFLVNFLSPNLLEVFREVSRNVERLTIMVSVPIEANRQWRPETGGLEVVCQRTKTVRRVVRHPGGYEEELFVHIPLDTFGQLRRLRPDVVVSHELGARSVTSAVFRATTRSTRHVISVYASEHSEAGRGLVRRWLRRRLLKRADLLTYNGPSCFRYLKSLGASPHRMMPWNYAADPQKVYRGPIQEHSSSSLRLLTIGQFVERKGVVPAARQLSDWARSNPNLEIHWTLAGTGPQQVEVDRAEKPSNLHLDFTGHCDQQQLQKLYRDHAVLLFPTLGDEWGLVVDEALASGLAVIGSVYSQAVETLISGGVNGWSFDPHVSDSMGHALDRWRRLSASEELAMRNAARQSMAMRTHSESAEQFLAAVEKSTSRIG